MESKIKLKELYQEFFSFLDKVDKLVLNYYEKKIPNHVHSKHHNERFTDVDWLAQRLFENILKTKFPKIKFVGEEDTSVDIGIDLSKFDTYFEYDNFHPSGNTSIIKQFIEENLDVEIDSNKEVVILMDPIDATNQLIKENYEPLTVLIGICIDSIPTYGIIHHPLCFSNDKKPLTLFNVHNKGVFAYDCSQIKEIKVNNASSKKYNFILSGTRTTQETLDFLGNFPNSKITPVNGLGNKALNMILAFPEYENVYFKPKKQVTCYWDICGADAITRELGGGIFDSNGNFLEYKFNKEEILLDTFTICNRKALDEILKVFKEKYHIKE